MKNKWVLVLGILAAFGAVFIGCDNGSSGGGSSEFDGTWTKGSFTVVINGTGFTIKSYGANVQKGTFAYNDASISFTATHDWIGNSWTADEYTASTYGYTLSGNTLTLTLITYQNLYDSQFIGTWTR
ncbi:MAG: hypothetical protein LBC67_06140 [Spirochaetales bacterium]|jgi:hypothetical protein|nr:hypothetical protein [Spirochaetales bacterium]